MASGRHHPTPNNLLSNARRQISSTSGSGRPMSRQELAEAVNAYLWDKHRYDANLDRSYIGKLERGLHRWPCARYREGFRHVLNIDRDAGLGFFVNRSTPEASGSHPQQLSPAAPSAEDRPSNCSPTGTEITDTSGMMRRELLRLVSLSGALLAAPWPSEEIDEERLDFFADGSKRLDRATVDDYARVNSDLWAAFNAATPKASISPLVNRQLDALVSNFRRSHGTVVHRLLCAVAADLLQLAGELAFDADRYEEAEHCYSLAARFGSEAAAYDLWACAMVRHAFVSVYDRAFTAAVPMLDVAVSLANRGDSTLSTRYWVQAVRAQALAGGGDLSACQQALDDAEGVSGLSGSIHNGGWLRFDGSRLAEERGACYVELQRPNLAEPVLTDALRQGLSLRRRGAVLTDLAVSAAQQGNAHEAVLYGGAALDTVRQSGSGAVSRKLHHLRHQLTTFRDDGHVRHLDKQIIMLTDGLVRP